MFSIIVACNKKLVECFIIHNLLSIKTCKPDKVIPVSPPPPPPPDHWTCRSWSAATRQSGLTAACISGLSRFEISSDVGPHLTLGIVDWFVFFLQASSQSFLYWQVPSLAFVCPEEWRLGSENDRSVIFVDRDAGHIRNKDLAEGVLNVLDEEENPAGAVNVDVHAEFVPLLRQWECL